MALKTAKDVEKLQKQMSEQFERYLEATQPSEGSGTVDADPHLLIERARASLEAAIHDREEGLRMADLRIERRKNELASLENNLKRASLPVKEAVQEKRKPKAKNRTGEGG